MYPDSFLYLPISNQIKFVLLVSVAVLTIASHEFDAFNHGFNALNIKCELGKSGLNNNKYGFDCGELASHIIDTIDAVADRPAVGFKFDQICVGLTEIDNLECDLSGVLPTPATATIITNKNEIEMKNQNGAHEPHTHTQAQAQAQTKHSTAPVINRSNSMVNNGIELCEFNTIRCIFSGNIDGIGLQYDMFSGMFVFVFIFICFFNCFVVKCYCYVLMLFFFLITFWTFFYFWCVFNCVICETNIWFEKIMPIV